MLSRFFLAASFVVVSGAFAQDRILVLSGGIDPANNHFSQYLQTKTLADSLRAQRGSDQVSVLFGAGNNPETPKLAADVHRVRPDQGSSLNEMVFGVIDSNAPATKKSVTQYFQSLGKLKPEDTVFLFVSDHGSPNSDDKNFKNNCINLWDHDARTMSNTGGDASCLSRVELQGMLGNVPARHKVFVMSQCFSGGFHQISVNTVAGYPSADPNVCGFTAVPEDTTASGCTPDVDGPGYKGYERFFTQQLTGTDVVSGKAMPYSAKHNLLEAHVAAALEDVTKDIPLRTSDYFLEQWSRTIGGRDFQPRTKKLSAEAAQKRFMNAFYSGPPALTANRLIPAEVTKYFSDKLDYLKKTTALLMKSDAEIAAVYQNGTPRKLELAMQTNQQDIGNTTRKMAQISYETRQDQYIVMREWSAAITNGKVASATAEERDTFEPFLLENNRTESLWYLSFLTANVPSVAPKFGHYLSSRGTRMQEWARGNADEEIRDAQKSLDNANLKMQPLQLRAELLERRRDNLRRVLLVRQDLAAVDVLSAMEDGKALEQLQGLLICENVSL